MQKVAKVGYFTRIMAMMHVSWGLPLHTFLIMAHMFQVDGFSFGQRIGLWARGLWWLYKPGGLYSPVLGHYFAYYKPGYHPWKAGQMRTTAAGPTPRAHRRSDCRGQCPACGWNLALVTSRLKSKCLSS